MPCVDRSPWIATEVEDRALLDEARRQMTVCAVCKYCNGLCPVFSAADARFAAAEASQGISPSPPSSSRSGTPGPTLSDGDLLYLANLCHDCRACWHACQFRPPHAFGIALPAVLARVRALSWQRLAGLPAWASGAASRTGAVACLALACVLGVPLLTLAVVPSEALFGAHTGPGAFHAVVPRGPMVWGAALAVLLPLAWVAVAMARFWRGIGGGSVVQIRRALPRAARDILALRHLDGGGVGCGDVDDRGSFWRRRWHHLIFYGFLLCVAATLSAAVAHHLFGMCAPYPWTSAPVLLGTVGGGSLLAGVTGMAILRWRADPAPQALETRAGGSLLLALLAAVAASGLVLLGLRETAAMGMLLALHLGTVLALFVTLPVGRLMHAPFRALAVLRAAIERGP